MLSNNLYSWGALGGRWGGGGTHKHHQHQYSLYVVRKKHAAGTIPSANNRNCSSGRMESLFVLICKCFSFRDPSSIGRQASEGRQAGRQAGRQVGCKALVFFVLLAFGPPPLHAAVSCLLTLYNHSLRFMPTSGCDI